jgi:signal transduction histidine kinase
MTTKFGVHYSLYLCYLLFLWVLIFTLFLLPLLLWQLILLVSFVFIYYWILLTKHFWLSHPYAIKKIVLTELNECYVQFKNDQIVHAHIVEDTILMEYFVLLNFQIVSKQLTQQSCYSYYNPMPSSVFLTADRVNSEHFRKIKCYLRFLPQSGL